MSLEGKIPYTVQIMNPFEANLEFAILSYRNTLEFNRLTLFLLDSGHRIFKIWFMGALLLALIPLGKQAVTASSNSSHPNFNFC